MKTSAALASKISFVYLAGIFLADNLSQATASGQDGYAKYREFAANAVVNTYYFQETPPCRGVVVQPGTVTGVLLKPANPWGDVLLRIISGPLKGSIVQGSYSENKMVFININNIRTPYGTDVWMPICKCSDIDGEVDVPRVQVDRGEWVVVKNGGTLDAGAVVHIRILDQVQFDAPLDKSSIQLVAHK
jgi:hypothetical protein